MYVVNFCMVLHPMESIKDILVHTGMVRYLYETQEQKLIYVITEQFEKSIRKHYNDLPDLTYEVLTDFSSKSLLKLLMGKYKNIKNRMFFGPYDKYRFDSYKNICKDYDNKTFEPYTMYGFDQSIMFTHFLTCSCREDDVSLIKFFKSVANWDYRLFSKADLIPMDYKKNCVIAVNIDKIFNHTNFFNSLVLVDKTRYIHLTDRDDFSLFVYFIYKSQKYNHLFENTKVYLFHQDRVTHYEYPSNWKLIKYVPV
uniref:Uncharacterized protein n=1 Tax=Pyramimonas orientalis virus TaxID=455367 RepID=A0A7M3UP21_POV01|nr:hypothetical protein HWQ62_00340 [Pyramimonas orientalis virus]